MCAFVYMYMYICICVYMSAVAFAIAMCKVVDEEFHEIILREQDVLKVKLRDTSKQVISHIQQQKQQFVK